MNFVFDCFLLVCFLNKMETYELMLPRVAVWEGDRIKLTMNLQKLKKKPRELHKVIHIQDHHISMIVI